MVSQATVYLWSLTSYQKLYSNDIIFPYCQLWIKYVQLANIRKIVQNKRKFNGETTIVGFVCSGHWKLSPNASAVATEILKCNWTIMPWNFSLHSLLSCPFSRTPFFWHLNVGILFKSLRLVNWGVRVNREVSRVLSLLNPW